MSIYRKVEELKQRIADSEEDLNKLERVTSEIRLEYNSPYDNIQPQYKPLPEFEWKMSTLPTEPCNCDDCEAWRRRPYSGDSK